MAKAKPPTMSRRQLSLRGVAMVDTIRGQVRIRKWPRKRGTPKSAAQRFWIDWFRQANYLAKYASDLDQVNAISITKGTMLYPRDVMLKAMRGSLYWWIDEQGKKWMPSYFREEVSNSLDAIGQQIGQLLYRATDRWRALNPGTANQVLTSNGVGEAPEWRDSAGGGGAWAPIATYTPTVDGANKQLVIPLPAGYSTFKLLGWVSPEATSRAQLIISRDNQASWIESNYRWEAVARWSGQSAIGRYRTNAYAHFRTSGQIKANQRGAFEITIYDAKDTAANIMTTWNTIYRDVNDWATHYEGSGIRTDTGIVTDLRLDLEEPYASGSVHLLGLA